MEHSKMGRRLRTGLLIASVGGLFGLSSAMAVSSLGEPPAPGGVQGEQPQELTPAEIAQMMAARMGQGGSRGQNDSKREFPSFDEVSKDYRKVVSTADGESYYNLWVRDRDGQMLAELPRGYEQKRQFFAMTVAGGEDYAGLQAGDIYCYWKRYDKRLALIAPQISRKSSGDPESRSSVERLFTDRVILDIPIVCIGPNGQPVIDMDDLLVGNMQTFFPGQRVNRALTKVAEAKAFPRNVEIEFEAPAAGGVIKTYHYSISDVPRRTGYKPREADQRVGFFTTTYMDLGEMDSTKMWKRYINRWHLEKRDPSLKMSPPKEPIVFYVDHATPVKYRRYVKQGVDYWNKAFRQIGIDGAIEVYFQDAQTGAHMDKDPEDVRYNFIRWLSNGAGTAIGPSRVHPETGQILDADIVLTDGFIRGFYTRYHDIIPQVAMENFSPEALAWLEAHPSWDPRIRLLPPAERRRAIAERLARGPQAMGGHPAAQEHNPILGDEPFDGLVGRHSQTNGMCLCAEGKALQMSLLRMHLELLEGRSEVPAQEKDILSEQPDDIPPEVLEMIKKQLEQNPDLINQVPEHLRAKLAGTQPEEPEEPEEGDDGEGEGDEPTEPKEPQSLLDGIPEEFVGPLLADLVAHECGHTLGLRHNFKGSSIQTLDEINSEEMKDKTWGASVMDYNGFNIRMESGEVQGNFSMTDIGPYDMWAIEYGYTFDDPAKVASRAAEPDKPYGTDEDTWGPDPLAQRWDLGADPIEYAREKMRLANWHRERLLDRFVDEGESWSEARRGYNITLSQQVQAISMMSRWIGGSYISRAKKGDPGAGEPSMPVEASKQREALSFIIENAFRDEAFGLTPKMLRAMVNDRWWDEGGMRAIFDDPAWPVHDRIMGVQASALSMIMNPGTLSRVFDNELRVDEDDDAITLPEVIDTVYAEIFSELETTPNGRRFTARKPMISSLRRNLQREMIDRLIDLSLEGDEAGPAGRAIANLATLKLRTLSKRIGELTEGRAASTLDPYTLAHLSESKIRIDKALDAQYIYNIPDFAPANPFAGLFLQEQNQR